MRLLHIITGVNVGGAETMLARLLENARLTPEIHQEVLTLMSPGVAGERIAKTGTPVHSLDMRTGRPSLSAAVRLVALTRSIRPDLIMGWMHHGQLAASLAALMMPEPTTVIWNVRHSLNGFRQEKLLTRLVLRIGGMISRTPAAIIYNSRAARSQYRDVGYRPRCTAVIPNGFDSSVFAPREPARRTLCSTFGLPEKGTLIGMVARNHPMKDVSNLLAGFSRMAGQFPAAHLFVAGEGMDQPGPAAKVMLQFLPPHRCTLVGHRTDVAEWLAGLDILALPSAWGEGFPNIVGEAMACGVPCVATDVGDAKWVIGATGRVVPPANSVALADALLELAQLGVDGRAVLGRAARDRILEHFALPKIVDHYAALYRRHGGHAASQSPASLLETAGEAQ